MSKGNVAHRKPLALCGFSSKMGYCELFALATAIHSSRSLYLSRKEWLTAEGGDGNSSGCILNRLMFTPPRELKSMRIQSEAPVPS